MSRDLCRENFSHDGTACCLWTDHPDHFCFWRTTWPHERPHSHARRGRREEGPSHLCFLLATCVTLSTPQASRGYFLPYCLEIFLPAKFHLFLVPPISLLALAAPASGDRICMLASTVSYCLTAVTKSFPTRSALGSILTPFTYMLCKLKQVTLSCKASVSLSIKWA